MATFIISGETISDDRPFPVSISELTAATLLADGTVIPTTSLIGAVQLVHNGATLEFRRTSKVFKTFDLSASASEQTIWAPASGKKFRFMGIVITAGGAVKLTFRDHTAGSTIFLMTVAGNIPYPISFGNGIPSGVADRVLTIQASASVTLVGTVYGTEE